MRQLTCTSPGTIEWTEVPEPRLVDPDDALVRPIAVARCEIDPLLVLTGPTRADCFALGHEAVVEVVEIGENVASVRPGALALPSFQVSCGACAPCKRGKSAICASYPLLSDYGMEPLSGVEYGGMLSDLVRVPHANTMLTPMPIGLDPVAMASVPDNVLDGYRAVAPHLARQPGADVAVVIHGSRSIGLYAALAAIALGAGKVTVASDDDDTLAIADRIGTHAERIDLSERPTGQWDIVVDSGLSPQGFEWAMRATKPEGVLHSVSFYFGDTPTLAFRRLYTLGIEFHIGRAHSASLLPEVVELVAIGALQPDLVTTKIIDWADAPAHYLDPTVKLIVTR
jgi:alcohol dehydrogenase